MTRALIVAFLATIAVTFVFAEDLILGGPVPDDHSIRNTTIIRKPRPYSRKAIVGLGDGSNITSIRATDHNVASNASVRVIIGGIGHPAVILYFQSPKNQGLNFTVEVRGVRPPKPIPPPPPPPTSTPTAPSETTEPEEETDEEAEESRFLKQVYFVNN